MASPLLSKTIHRVSVGHSSSNLSCLPVLKNDLLLHEAVIKNESDAVRKVLKETVDVDSRNNVSHRKQSSKPDKPSTCSQSNDSVETIAATIRGISMECSRFEIEFLAEKSRNGSVGNRIFHFALLR